VSVVFCRFLNSIATTCCQLVADCCQLDILKKMVMANKYTATTPQRRSTGKLRGNVYNGFWALIAGHGGLVIYRPIYVDRRQLSPGNGELLSPVWTKLKKGPHTKLSAVPAWEC